MATFKISVLLLIEPNILIYWPPFCVIVCKSYTHF